MWNSLFIVFSTITSDRCAYTCSVKINTRWKKSIFYFPRVIDVTPGIVQTSFDSPVYSRTQTVHPDTVRWRDFFRAGASISTDARFEREKIENICSQSSFYINRMPFLSYPMQQLSRNQLQIDSLIPSFQFHYFQNTKYLDH